MIFEGNGRVGFGCIGVIECSGWGDYVDNVVERFWNGVFCCMWYYWVINKVFERFVFGV